MTGGAWRMLAVLGLLAAVSSFLVSPADAQGCSPPCGSHATCYENYSRGVYYCVCNGYYTGDGYNCKHSTWRLVLYILSSVIGFILIFFLCLSCLGYFRRRAPQPVGYPMQPMGNPPYSYPPQQGLQSNANPAMYTYPPQTGYPAQGAYPGPQPGYPVNAYPPQVVNNYQQQQQPSSDKIPGPSGSV